VLFFLFLAIVSSEGAIDLLKLQTDVAQYSHFLAVDDRFHA
jgi:hypothetical protein